MLKSVQLKNFKLHEDTQIEAAPITVFIGPNNSGKSSIFHAMLLLRQAASRNDQYLCQPPGGIQPPPSEHYLYSPNVIVDVGAFDEVVRNGRKDILIRLCGGTKAQGPTHGLNEASVDVTVGVKDNRLVRNSGSVTCLDSQANWELADGHPTQPNPVTLRLGGVRYKIRIADTFGLTQPAGFEATPGPPHETALMYSEFSQWLGSIPSKLLGSVHPIYALRGFEEWGYPITDRPPANLELMTLHDRALALPNALASDRQLKGKLSDRLEELLHISIDFEVIHPGKRLKIWAKHTGNKRGETLFANEGTGANQIPFIFVPVLLTPPNETILLSEPEAHLHPKGQCELTRILLTVARKENIQFFIETHSEHVLHVILNAVARGEWAKDDVALHYFENVEGTAQVKRLGINEHGQVDGGLPGFFDQSLAELTEYLGALGKR
jgi:energy-coupling factor transporter ATP-binding protein EcfA2